MVLNVSTLKEQPFAIVLHITKENKTELSHLFPAEKFDICQFETTHLCHYELGAVVYANTETYNK